MSADTTVPELSVHNVPLDRPHPWRDSKTMLARNLRHALRYPGLSLMTILMPVALLLLFVGVFGNTMGNGIASVHSGGGSYANYLAPGIILMGASANAVSIAVSIAMDMTEGIINRFRTMAISRASVLIGHVVGNVIQTVVSIVLVVGVALLMGFRPNANVFEWLATLGLLVLLTLALSWLCAGIGLVTKSVETASNWPMLVTFLPMLGSGFVPPESMPAGIRWFAEYQPFTPINETLRGLLTGTPIGNNGIIAVAWCVGLAIIGYVWSTTTFKRAPKK